MRHDTTNRCQVCLIRTSHKEVVFGDKARRKMCQTCMVRTAEFLLEFADIFYRMGMMKDATESLDDAEVLLKALEHLTVSVWGDYDEKQK